MLCLSRKPSERLLFEGLFEFEVVGITGPYVDVRLHLPAAPLIDLVLESGYGLSVGGVRVEALGVRANVVKFGITAPDCVKVKRTHSLPTPGLAPPAGTDVYAAAEGATK